MNYKRSKSGRLIVPEHEGVRGYRPEDVKRYERWKKRWRPKCVIARVQVVGNNNGSGTGAYDVTITSSTAGNFIVVAVGHYTNSGTAPSVADNLASAYATAYNLASLSSPNTSTYQSVFYLENCPSGITTVTVTPGTSTSSALVIEYSGVATSSALDAVISATKYTATSTSWTSNSIVTSITDLLIGVVWTRNDGDANFTSTGAWSNVASAHNSTDGDDLFVQEQLNAAAGTYNASGTADSSSFVSGIASFKAAAAGRTTKNTRAFTLGTEIGMNWRSGL